VKVDAVILAGGEGAVIDPTVHIKGLVPVAGRPMVEWVVDALRESSSIAEIAVVVPTAENLGSWADKVDKLVINDGRFIDNALAGVDSFRNDRSVLVTTGDLPALTGAAIDDFVEQSRARGADFSYPLVTEEDMIAQFPGSERTFVKISGGPVTGGNMMVITPALAEKAREIGQRFFETRKSPLKMARVVGPKFVWKMARGTLDPSDVEAKLGALLGGTCAAIYTRHASIGADIDKPIDVVVAERVLYEQRAGRNIAVDGE